MSFLFLLLLSLKKEVQKRYLEIFKKYRKFKKYRNRSLKAAERIPIRNVRNMVRFIKILSVGKFFIERLFLRKRKEKQIRFPRYFNTISLFNSLNRTYIYYEGLVIEFCNQLYYLNIRRKNLKEGKKKSRGSCYGSYKTSG